YGAFRGQGVFISPNQGTVWNQMLGLTGNPLLTDFGTGQPLTVNPPQNTPSGGNGRILLAKPALTGTYLPDGTYTGNTAEDVQYETWLYAMVVATDGTLDGVFLTKDNGQNWTQLQIPRFRIKQFNPVAGPDIDIPTNDPSRGAYQNFSGGFLTGQGNV